MAHRVIPIKHNNLSEQCNINMQDSHTYRPILDGEVIDIISASEEDRPNPEIWQLQWDLIKMCALAGAADEEDDTDEDDEEADEDDDWTHGRW